MRSLGGGRPESLLLFGAGAAVGLFALLICGIPFVPPFSSTAVLIGTIGWVLTVGGIILPLVRGDRGFFLVLAILPMAINSFAIYLGALGKHLIDSLEGH